MGFDIAIRCILNVCPLTGMLYHYGIDSESFDFKKIYAMPVLNVPTEYRKYVQGRGSVFHAYTNYFNELSITTTDIDTFLDQYPVWSNVCKWSTMNAWDDQWTETDHDLFKKTLMWFNTQKIVFEVSWSY